MTMTQETLLFLAAFILVFPLTSFLINIFYGKRLGRLSGVIGTTVLGIDFIVACVVAYFKIFTDTFPVNYVQMRFDWINLGTYQLNVGIGIDNLAALMLLVVTLISFLVHLFSTEYMRGDVRYGRFFSYLGLFTFSMLGIVIANNFFFMYVFWELVGISSYLLIGFWYEKDSASNAGKKAFITNRVGDFGFFIGILILFFTYGSFMFDDIFGGMSSGIIPFKSPEILTAAGILIFCGAIGKSAQFPLHVWLPDAMEGPTPVSALIHAATMVAAGVYMVARVFPMFTADALLFIAYIGAITAFVSATIAITQNDFKRVLAYSTVSQLGYMIMALGVGAWATGFLHLMTHAWFKACLFLASGSVIHAMHHSMHKAHNHTMDPQDINNMGGLRKTMPITYFTFLFVTLALSGVPLTSGFLSKDSILAGTLAFANLSGHWLIPIAGFASAGMTAFYMFRLTIVSFHGKPKTEIAAHTHENNLPVVLPLIILSFLSLWFLYSPNPFDAHAGWYYEKMPAPKTAVPAEYQWDFLVHYDQTKTGEHETSEHKLLPPPVEAIEHSEKSGEEHGNHHYLNKYEEEMHHAHMPAMILSLIIASLGILGAFLLWQFKAFNARAIGKQLYPLYLFSYNKWYIDELYEATIIKLFVYGGKFLAWFDNTFIDGAVNLSAALLRWLAYFIGHFDNIIIDGIVNLLANIIGFFGALFRKMQTGRVQTYVVMAIIGIMVLVYVFI